jgi:hypothetical protein
MDAVQQDSLFALPHGGAIGGTISQLASFA